MPGGELGHAAKIKDRDLAHLTCDALTTHQAEGEIAFASGFVVGSGLTDKHEPDASGKTRGKSIRVKIVAQQNGLKNTIC
ncbi:MAG: hypothetical protein CVU16_13170 [Betaproteobacteria bacterium HGW-Betaproteobacteria-10]|nr:MAG: hypothetical protein CVU16_13170 [Betaproteobacteria bacterium HGW-Betaproteobacteria-10]